MQKCEKRVRWDYYDKFHELNEQYLPAVGEGETKASQIVTAVNKLVYKWYNDGDVFDNTFHLEGWANDLSSYANWLYQFVPETRSILNTIEDAKNEYEYECLLKDLSDKMLDKEFLQEQVKQPKIDSIYEADGKFKFIDLDDFESEDDDYFEDDEDEEM